MYQDFYSLSAEPFRLSPDPRFCYQHPSYAKARAYMQYALERGEGFVLVTGVPGTGKTTLIEDLLAGLEDAPVIVSHLTTTQLQGDDLLRMVCYEIGADAQGLDKATLLRRIQEVLLYQAGKGQRSLVLVDEAQDLSESALEELRLLTNLQVNRRPLLQIFLVGQDPLRRMVAKPSMEQLKQRIVAACHLQPLKLNETREYLRHRLTCAGWRGDPIISGDVVRLVQLSSQGIPRRINIVADRLLLHGYVEGKHELGEADARVVVLELRNEQLFSPGAEEVSAKAVVSDVDAPVPLALLGESAEPDKQAPAKAVAAAQAERRGNAPSSGNVARLAVREVPSAAAHVAPADRGDRGDRLDAVTSGSPEMDAANKPAQLERSPTDRPDQQPRGGPREAEVRDGFARERDESPVVDRVPKGRASRDFLTGFLAGVLLLSLVAFAVVLGRPDVASLVKSHWTAWMTGLPSPENGSTTQQDGRPVASGTTADPIPALEPTLPERPEPVDRQSALPSGVSSGVKDATVASREDEATPTSLSGLELTQDPERAVAVATSGSTGVSGSHSPGLSEPDVSPLVEVDVGDLQESTSDAAGYTQPLPVLPAPIEPVASAPMPNDSSPLADRPDRGLVAEVRREQPPSSPTRVDPLAGGAVRFDAAPQADGSGRSPVGEIRHEPPPVLESLHAGLWQLGLPAQRLDSGALKLSLRKEVPFGFDSAEVPQRSRQVLDRLAALLGEHRQWTLTVVGHTDDTGPEQYNLTLSLERARSVADYLVQKGLPAGQVFSAGKGESEPAAAGDMAAGYRKWLDRRIEMVVRSTEQLPRQDMAASYR